MLSGVLFFLCAGALVCAALRGGAAELTPGLLAGAEQGIRLCLTLAGPVALWSGVSEVFFRAGITQKAQSVVWPLLRRLVRPQAASPEVSAALAENFTANLLGIGNAATPAGLRAAALLGAEGDHAAVMRLALLNSLSVQLLPLTAAALRASHGAPAPMAILPGVLFASLVGAVGAFGLYGLVARHG